MPSPGRYFRGPTKQELLARIQESGLAESESVYLGQGMPSAVLKHEGACWVLRALVVKNQRSEPSEPFPPGYPGPLEPGEILLEALANDALVSAIENIDWRWDPPPAYRVEIVDLGPEIGGTIAALASTALFDNSRRWVEQRVAVLPCVLWENACGEQVDRARRILERHGAQIRVTQLTTK